MPDLSTGQIQMIDPYDGWIAVYEGTPLQYAVLNDHLELAEALCKLRASIHQAAHPNKLQKLDSELKSPNLNPLVKEHFQKMLEHINLSPLELARKRGNTEMQALLKSYDHHHVQPADTAHSPKLFDGSRPPISEMETGDNLQNQGKTGLTRR